MPFFDKYPYTNFHNVNLDWILERVKEWGQMVEDNNTRFENLEQANEDFKTYVTEYLENLDVQTAIDDKLDRMFESGELTEYLQPYVSSTVTTWLDQNITEPVGVVIDSSLTVSGAAADAKAVGDRLSLIVEDTVNQDARNKLLNLFRIVGYVDSNAIEIFNQLEDALITDTFYDIWNWDSRSSGVNKLYRSVSPMRSKVIDGVERGIEYGDNLTNNTRRGFYVSRGRQPFVNYTNGQLANNMFPIPVPKNAHKVTVSIFPDTQQLATYIFKYVGNSDDGGFDYIYVGPNKSWATGVDITEFTPDRNLFICFNIRRDANNSVFSTATEPELSIVYE